MRLNSIFLFLLVGVLIQIAYVESACAFPMMGNDNSQGKKPGPVQSFQPPSENTLKLQCEPYRHEAAVLSQKFFLIRLLVQPRRIWLMYEYRHCVRLYMDQENVYLHHVNIEQPPSLPKLDIPPAGNAPSGSETPSTTPPQSNQSHNPSTQNSQSQSDQNESKGQQDSKGESHASSSP